MIVAIVAALVVGCDNKPAEQAIQEVNDENCKIKVIKQIEDKETREQFAGRCSRRPVGIAPTKKPKNWLELTN
jgi:entry exclusion lipoprotein TrbK